MSDYLSNTSLSLPLSLFLTVLLLCNKHLFVFINHQEPPLLQSQIHPHLLAEPSLNVDDTHGDAADPSAADDDRLTPPAEVLLVGSAVEEPGHPARSVSAHLNKNKKTKTK